MLAMTAFLGDLKAHLTGRDTRAGTRHSTHELQKLHVSESLAEI